MLIEGTDEQVAWEAEHYCRGGRGIGPMMRP